LRPNDNYNPGAYEKKYRKTKTELSAELDDIEDRIKDVLKEFRKKKIDWNRLGDREWTAQEFITEYAGSKGKPVTVLSYFDGRIKAQSDMGRVGNAACYQNARARLEEFIISKGNDDMRFSDFDESFMRAFCEFYKTKGNKDGSISVYMRTIRAVYMQAVVDKKAFNTFKWKIPSGNPDKRALSKDEFIKFKEVVLPDEPDLERARDYFLCSFYLRGCNFIDLALAKVRQVNNGIFTYKRQKTLRAKKAKVFNIKIPWQIQPIIDKYIKGKT
jgi:hypothetical protein